MEASALKSKAKKIFANANAANVILIANTNYQDPNFLYLTDINSGLFEGSLILLFRRGAKILVSALEYEDASRHIPKGMELIKIESSQQIKSILNSGLKGKTLGTNDEFMTYAMHKRITAKYSPAKVIDVSSALSNARLVKEESEIKHIKKAAKITKRAMLEIRKSFKPGITEKTLAQRFDDISAKLGSDGPSFSTIVCFGANASMPHHRPDGTKLKYGDFVLIDAGAKSRNYCSDITRTFIFGKDKKRIKDYEKKMEMYNLVKSAQKKAIDSIRAGVKGKDVHNLAADYINSYKNGKYNGKFIHSLGHSVGIEVHDGPGLSPGATKPLKQGMVVTVEPGVYLSGFGGVRIEDDILVTKDGSITL
ncbi:MAG: M24 family metallopeptidase [Candidatus Micrarchaeaceae archaeon]